MAFLHEGVGFARIEEAIYDDTRPRGGILAVQVFRAANRDIDVLHLGFCGDMDRYDEQQEQQAATLNRQIEKIQNQQVNVAAIEKIEAKSVPFSSKVAVERENFERLSTLAKSTLQPRKRNPNCKRRWTRQTG